MDKVELGRRLAEARDLAGMTQESVARAVGIDRSAVVLLEKGERNLKVPELVQIAAILKRPLSFFVEPPVPAVISRRSAPAGVHDSTRALDAEIAQFAIDARAVAATGLLPVSSRPESARVPRTHAEAESAAASFRKKLGLGTDPITALGRASELLGLYTLVVGLGESGPDGGCVEVASEAGTVGVAVINGDAPSGRRRMTLAHELGHWLFGDAYDAECSGDSEKMINSFAIHFLAPRAGVRKVWSSRESDGLRARALAVGVEFQLSWTATLSQLQSLDLVTRSERESLEEDEPRSGDYRRLGLSWVDELQPPYVSPAFVAAVLQGYTTGVLAPGRVLELLRGVLGVGDLPRVEHRDEESLERAFRDHGVATTDG